MRDKSRIIYDNYDAEEYYPDSTIKEIAIDCEWIEDEEELTDSKIEQFRQDEMDDWFDTEWEELTRFFDGKTVIFFGSLGLWTGRHAAGKIGTFEDLFHKAMIDCEYLKIYDDRGHLFLQCSHHDGTNVFEIKTLTRAGIDYMDRWEYSTDRRTERDAHEQVIKRYSRLPRFADTVYGKI